MPQSWSSPRLAVRFLILVRPVAHCFLVDSMSVARMRVEMPRADPLTSPWSNPAHSLWISCHGTLGMGPSEDSDSAHGS